VNEAKGEELVRSILARPLLGKISRLLFSWSLVPQEKKQILRFAQDYSSFLIKKSAIGST
jgi:hypothetical protein